MNQKPTPKKEKTPEPYPVLSTFMFTDEEIMNSPSRKKGNMSYELEMNLRRYGAWVIKDIIKSLNAPYQKRRHKISCTAMCVAMIYLQRFYMFHSLSIFDPIQLACGCLFLAAKYTECPRSVSHFSIQLYSMMNPEDPDSLAKDETQEITDLITTIETCILRTFGFELEITLPHVYVIETNFPMHLQKATYTLCTEILQFTTLCLQYGPKTLAAASFFVAAGRLGIDMEKNYGKEWYLQVDDKLTEDLLNKVVTSFIASLKEVTSSNEGKPVEFQVRKRRHNDTLKSPPPQRQSEHRFNNDESLHRRSPRPYYREDDHKLERISTTAAVPVKNSIKPLVSSNPILTRIPDAEIERKRRHNDTRESLPSQRQYEHRFNNDESRHRRSPRQYYREDDRKLERISTTAAVPVKNSIKPLVSSNPILTRIPDDEIVKRRHNVTRESLPPQRQYEHRFNNDESRNRRSPRPYYREGHRRSPRPHYREDDHKLERISTTAAVPVKNSIKPPMSIIPFPKRDPEDEIEEGEILD